MGLFTAIREDAYPVSVHDLPNSGAFDLAAAGSGPVWSRQILFLYGWACKGDPSVTCYHPWQSIESRVPAIHSNSANSLSISQPAKWSMRWTTARMPLHPPLAG
jgi:hypothetical protein